MDCLLNQGYFRGVQFEETLKLSNGLVGLCFLRLNEIWFCLGDGPEVLREDAIEDLMEEEVDDALVAKREKHKGELEELLKEIKIKWGIYFGEAHGALIEEEAGDDIGDDLVDFLFVLGFSLLQDSVDPFHEGEVEVLFFRVQLLKYRIASHYLVHFDLDYLN